MRPSVKGQRLYLVLLTERGRLQSSYNARKYGPRLATAPPCHRTICCGELSKRSVFPLRCSTLRETSCVVSARDPRSICPELQRSRRQVGNFAAWKVTPFHIFHEPGTDPEHVENRLSPSLYLGTLVYNFHHHRNELYQE